MRVLKDEENPYKSDVLYYNEEYGIVSAHQVFHEGNTAQFQADIKGFIEWLGGHCVHCCNVEKGFTHVKITYADIESLKQLVEE